MDGAVGEMRGAHYRRAKGQVCRVGVLAIVICTAAVGISASENASDVVRLMSPLQGVRESIKSLDLVADSVVSDMRGGRVVNEQRNRVHLLYRADLKRTILESEIGGESATAMGDSRGQPPCKGGRSVRVVEERYPSPAWLYRFPEVLASSRCRVRPENGGHIIAVNGRVSSGELGAHAQLEVFLDGNNLPIRIVTYGTRHEVLDEIIVRWQRQRGQWLPNTVTYLYHSSLNLLTRTVTYRDVRINTPLSASIFESP